VSLFERNASLIHTYTKDYGIGVQVGSNFSTDGKNVKVLSEPIMEKLGMTFDQMEAMSLHSCMHEGGHIRHTDINTTQKELKKLHKKGYDIKTLFNIINIIEDCRIDAIVAKERPGYKIMQKKALDAVSEAGILTPSSNATFNMLKGVCFILYGTHKDKRLSMWDKAINWTKAHAIANLINCALKKVTSTQDVIKESVRIYDLHFQKKLIKKNKPTQSTTHTIQNKNENEETNEEINEEKGEGKGGEDANEDEEANEGVEVNDNDEKESEGEGEKEDEREGESEDVDSLIQEMIRSESGSIKNLVNKDSKEYRQAEQKACSSESHKKNCKDNTKYQLDRLEDDWVYHQSNEIVAYLSQEEQTRINKAVCKDMFTGTRSVFYRLKNQKIEPSVSKDDFLGVQYVNKDKYLSYNDCVSMGKLLAKHLIELLRAAREYDTTPSRQGLLDIRRIQRISVNDNQIFKKVEYKSEGGYRIDVVVDASGSNGGRYYQIRAQLLVLAVACVQANLPCRITMFSSSANITGLTVLKDYDDKCVDGVLKYMSSGSNMDGLAFKAIFEDIKLRAFDEKHIMLILSDGAPACSLYSLDDGSGEKSIRLYTVHETWTSQITRKTINVQEDLYRTISLMRRHMPVLGIYVGRPNNLIVEQATFGNDFVYIRTMETFVSHIATYLKKVIN